MQYILLNIDSIITYKDSEYEVSLEKLLITENGVFESNLGKIDVTPEQAEIHNRLVDKD